MIYVYVCESSQITAEEKIVHKQAREMLYRYVTAAVVKYYTATPYYLPLTTDGWSPVPIICRFPAHRLLLCHLSDSLWPGGVLTSRMPFWYTRYTAVYICTELCT